ncbi:MAG: lysophospholipid acyltransferase family protein [Pyrinomonadaceae bacterium]
MSDHLSPLPSEVIRENTTVEFPLVKSSKSRIAGKLRYWWSWAVAGALMLIVAAPSLVVLKIIDRRLWLYPLAEWGAKVWLAACGADVKVTGIENLDPDRSYVFVSNHRSYLDTAALFFFSGKRMGLVAKKELLKVPVLGWGMGFVNIIAIDRSDAEKATESMAKARSVLERGFSFGVFVEGTRAMPGELLPFKKGAFHLAVQTGTDIVPVAIRNTDWMMGKKEGVVYAGTVEMTLLPPISVGGYRPGDPVTELLLAARTAIAKSLAD